jgi:serine phosphatase RsbU (regulator of sigma subunit)
MSCVEGWGGNQPFDNAVVMPGLDAWVYSRPYGQSDAGGDVYYVSSCATGRITRLLLADVSGHGAVVSETARALRRLMQRFVNYIDQTAFVRSMNGQFAELSDAGTFATAIVSTFFAPTNELTLCVAGHPAPLHYRAATGTWGLLGDVSDPASGNTGNIPLGIIDMPDWAQFGVKLGVGDLVVCYTDSLIESKGRDGELLNVRGLLEIARSIDVSDPKQVIPDLLAAVAEQEEGNLTADDVTVLLFRPNGNSPGVPIRDRILAPLRVACSIGRAMVTRKGPIPWPEMSLPNIGGAMVGWFNRSASRPRSSH